MNEFLLDLAEKTLRKNCIMGDWVQIELGYTDFLGSISFIVCGKYLQFFASSKYSLLGLVRFEKHCLGPRFFTSFM